MQLGLFRFTDIDVTEWLALLNDAGVNRYLPLAPTPRDASAACQWMADKDPGGPAKVMAPERLTGVRRLPVSALRA
ncbi:hypothetical protein S7S_04025 [Isoalcanivorax pacificus W11-5]|uniref:Uncharacterized protein n=1 Tax=Isoalcanivorax pacificus W11-5 TaxID=391936 RepID=A0A0B4XLG7_9GAMM|nr:hypothetical protein S7S_04025 [Isoalcanivorax pacificus W11-5]